MINTDYNLNPAAHRPSQYDTPGLAGNPELAPWANYWYGDHSPKPEQFAPIAPMALNTAPPRSISDYKADSWLVNQYPNASPAQREKLRAKYAKSQPWNQPASAPSPTSPQGPSQSPQAPVSFNYQSGIDAGQLSDQAIGSALGKLAPPNPGRIPGAPQNAASALNQQYGDLLSRESSASRTDLSRDAAEKQAQMAMAYQNSRANASLGAFGYGMGLEQNRLGNAAANRQNSISLLEGLMGSTLGLFGNMT